MFEIQIALNKKIEILPKTMTQFFKTKKFYEILE